MAVYEALKKKGKKLEPEYYTENPAELLAILRQESKAKDELILRLQGELRRKLEFDELTGIYNRNTFCRKVRELLQEQEAEEFVLVRMDIEHFKLINDLYGEAEGNRLLVYIAEGLEAFRAEYFVYGRMYADNFVICCPARGSAHMDFIKNMQIHMQGSMPAHDVVIKFGLYYVTNRELSISFMCDRADQAVKQIKGKELQSYNVYQGNLRRTMMQEKEILAEMNDALEQGQFKLYLQPQYDLQTENIVGAEALVRWDHPVKGLIGPEVFLPVFERTGFIVKLDEYLWDSACRLLKKWAGDGLTPGPLAVNISRLDLYRTDLCDILLDLVEKYDLDPAQLQLEITENSYTENPGQIIEVTKELKSCGFRILLDDFGSGYTSLEMIKDVLVDILKIDLYFLKTYASSYEGDVSLRAFMRTADQLGLVIMAEGVENTAQASFLRDLGCRQAQGYYYAKPMPVEEYERLLAGMPKGRMLN